MDCSSALLDALQRPHSPAEVAATIGLPVVRVSELFLSLYAGGRVVAYCHDHFVRRELLRDFEDGPPQPEWSRSRHVMAALCRRGRTLDALIERTGLTARQVSAEIAALTTLGACRSANPVGADRGWSRVDACRDRRTNRPAVLVALAQTAIVAHLAQPMRQGDLAAVLGWSESRTGWWLRTLIHGRRVRLDSRGLFVATPVGPQEADDPGDPSAFDPTARLQPVRDSIMAFLLGQPRQAVEIASVVGRSVPCVTGHLRAMRVRGLVERIGYGRYARADMPGLPPPSERNLQRPGTPPPAQSRSERRLAARLGSSPSANPTPGG